MLTRLFSNNKYILLILINISNLTYKYIFSYLTETINNEKKKFT